MFDKLKHPMSARCFKGLSVFGKGYWVYMAGARDDEPNVPSKYDPAPHEVEEFNRGQHHAILEVQDQS